MDDTADRILEENDNFTLSSEIHGPVIAVFIALEMVAALVSNLFVLLVTLCHPTPRANWRWPSNIFLTNMLLVNLVVAIFVMPFIIIATASSEWVFGDTVEEKVGSCQFAAFMFWYIVILMNSTLAIISFDRFLFIVKANYYKRFMTTGVAVAIVIAMWLVTAFINSTPFFGFGAFAFSASPGSCFPVWENHRGYLAYFVVIIALLLTVIIVTSVWTFCFTRKFIKNVRDLDSTKSAEQDNIYAMRWRKLIGLFGTLSLVYAFSFMPPSLYLLLRLVVVLPDQLLPVVLVLFYLITILSPLVQSFFRKDIKDVISRILSKAFCHKQTVDNNTSTQSQHSLASIAALHQ